jgi:hypothetical protein
MKICPTCSRTYADDTFAFCLDDGSLLSASDPRPTLKGPAPRDTNPPKTEVLAYGVSPPSAVSAPVASPGRDFQSAGPYGSTLPQKRSARRWVFVGGIFAVAIFGLVAVLGYMIWKANRGSKAESASQNSTASTDFPVATKEPESKHVRTSFQPADGVWEGRGYQNDTKTTWAIKLTIGKGDYKVEYPDIPCQGKWSPNGQSTDELRFTEVITQGLARCTTRSSVIMRRTGDSQISCTYTNEGSRVVIATAVLNRNETGKN